MTATAAKPKTRRNSSSNQKSVGQSTRDSNHGPAGILGTDVDTEERRQSSSTHGQRPLSSASTDHNHDTGGALPPSSIHPASSTVPGSSPGAGGPEDIYNVMTHHNGPDISSLVLTSTSSSTVQQLPSSSSTLLLQSQPELSSSNQRHSQQAASLSVSVNQPPKMVIRRTLTPPTPITEEEGANSPTSESSDGCPAKMTIVSLRKILDEQEQLQTRLSTSPNRSLLSTSPSSRSNSHQHHHRPPSSPSAISKSSSRSSTLTQTAHLKPPPLFLAPLSPAPAVEAGTSNATASVSRLLTKNVHTTSTRPPDPPKQSAMKRGPNAQQVQEGEAEVQNGGSQGVGGGGSGDGKTGESGGGKANGLRLASAVSLMTGMINGVKRAQSNLAPSSSGLTVNTDGNVSPTGSMPGSGRSTPKRISFAELPESYASTRPEGSSRFREMKNSRSRRRSRSKSGLVNGDRKGKQREGHNEGDKELERGPGWFSKFLVGAASASAAGAGPGGPVHGLGMDERYEERMSRSGARFAGMGMAGSGMGPGFGSSGLDEWSL
ncbi:hypothetical protein AX16_007779 [Volvariella volvacea WC 439]|nr:hypothetical protein AX16_007779 [Volvariella volvacea WC 439]